ncbi:hypothetical protein Pth03_16690 [Planotetraspora thailandica]|uniref:Uncharacterized protein n=1 Tax=Planotetraspora thailandica TaxID=487172 RepID=A0A8J3VAN7_9ACTN|nr:hypothetical protein Pth03_16690 [Planotetraspora thailandica]
MLAVASAVPALALSGWLVAGLPLLLLGWFSPLPATLLGGGLAVAFCWYGLRRMPETVESSAWSAAGVFLVAVASAIFNGIFHGEQLIIRRDPATYAQYAIWVAKHGSLPIPTGDFGGPDRALRFASMGMYGWDGGIVPQFMPGPPIIHSIGYWLGGVPGLVLVPPVLGGLAVLVFGGTVARLVGARWAPVAALVFAVSLPILYTSRTTFSEIPSMILIFGGMSLLLDARFRLRAGALGAGFLGPATPAEAAGAVGVTGAARGARLMAGLAGLAFGLALLVRIDGLRDVLPVLAYAGLLVAMARVFRTADPGHTRVPEGKLGLPLLAGLLAGGGLGFAACYLLARPYLGYLSGSLKPLLAICAAVLVLTLVAVALAPWIVRRTRALAGGRIARRLPDLAAGLVVLVVVGLAVRPWVQTVQRVPTTPEDQLTAAFISKTQQVNHLPIDPNRLYYENSLYWVIWYVGVPVVVLATLAAAVLTRRMARGREFGWLLPLAIIAWTTVTTLWRPGITPDHPWASRRLAPIVIPGMILLAVWGLRWIRRRVRLRGYGTRLIVAGGAILLVVPAAITSIGTAFTPVDRGEAAAVAGLCRAIPSNASVLIVERATGDRFTQVVRGQCGVPTAWVAYPQGSDVPLHSDIERLIDKVRGTGRLPVLLAAEPGQLWPYGMPERVFALRSRQDERSLVDPPNGTWSLTVDVWMTIPA